MILITIIIFLILIAVILFKESKIQVLKTENKAFHKVQSTMSNSLRLKGIEVDRLLKKIKRLTED